MKEKLTPAQQVFLEYLIECEIADPASEEVRRKNTEEVPHYKYVYQIADKRRQTHK